MSSLYGVPALVVHVRAISVLRLFSQGTWKILLPQSSIHIQQKALFFPKIFFLKLPCVLYAIRYHKSTSVSWIMSRRI